VTLRAPAGGLIGGTAPRWDDVQVTGSLDDARALLAAPPLSLAHALGHALSARDDVDTSVLPPSLLQAAQTASATGAVHIESPATCVACQTRCFAQFNLCLANPFVAPFCPIWLSQCQAMCVQTGQC
jgi:hypothetical protein